MHTLVFLDLDDTLFQTLPKCPPGDRIIPGALARDGSPLSFLTDRQQTLFNMLDKAATIIPVTARNRDAFSRVQLSFRSFAILDFGGVILQPDGEPDAKWDAQIRPQAMKVKEEMEQIHRGVVEYIQAKKLGARARIIGDYGMPLYIVIKHPDANVRTLQTIQDEHLSFVQTGNFFSHRNHNNLSIIPNFLGKEHAMRYLLEEHFGDEPVLTLGIGDSVTDLGYLRECDYMIMPKASQLAERLHL